MSQHKSEMFRVHMPFRARLAQFIALRAYRGFCTEVLEETNFEQDPILLTVHESQLKESGMERGRTTRIVVRYDGGIVVEMRLLSWGEQGDSFGEQWSVQSITVRVQRQLVGHTSWDDEDVEWRFRSYAEEDLQSSIERWWGGKVVDTFHPLMGRAGQPGRIRFIA
ncbi:MAG: hypothetical protein WCG99_00485 [Candidatus Berkelbacteria bacterium]